MITAHVPKKIYSILQTNFPEAIASIDENETCLSSLPDLSKYQAIAVGPGIGQEKPTIDMLRSLFDKWRGPMVIDADGLNILSNHTDWLKWIPKNTILTPHAAEFRRLAGKSTDSFDELNKLQHLAVSIHCVVILKGAYTKIASPDGCIYINQTGNNGMATAGSGDVLTGIIVSLLAQGYQPIEAAKTGVFVHGLAGDLALNIKSHESLIATDIIENIGLAFKELQKKCLTDQVDRL
jgi:NAD(P)H-hydrate epimerase